MPEGPEILQEAHGSYIAQAASGGTATIQVYTTPSAPADQNRSRFLARLRTRYGDLLAQSLAGVAHLALELERHAEAVAPPVQLLYQSDQQPARSLPAGTTLTQVYTEAGYELLLLGAPGSGKSTLLLELASDLVAQAEHDEQLALPVIIPLSSWGNRRLPLEQWLSEQVALFYDLPRRLAERWVREERLLPLLDGLDEMQEEARADCIAAINAYHRAHLHPLLVASRQIEYEAAAKKARLALHRAVIIQPLTENQVNASLTQLGKPGEELREVLEANSILQELAMTPLLLSILLLTTQRSGTRDLLALTNEAEQQEQILARYIESMLARKQALNYLSPQQMVHALQWLAQQMRYHSQTIFYLEHLQPDWLASRFQSSYRWWTTQLPAMLLGILLNFTCMLLLFSFPIDLKTQIQCAALGALAGWFISRPAKNDERQTEGRRWPLLLRRICRGIPISLAIGFLFLISFGPLSFTWTDSEWTASLIMGLCSLALATLPLAPPPKPVPPEGRWSFLGRLIQTFQLQRIGPMIIIIGLGIGLNRWSFNGEAASWGKVIDAGYNAAKFGLNASISAFLLNLLLEARTRGVVLAERLHWTWQSFRQSLFAPKHLRDASLVGGSILLLALARDVTRLVSHKSMPGLPSALASGLILAISYGLLYWTLLGLFQGVSSEQIEDWKRHQPNQGIRRSLANSFLLALIGGLLIGTFGPLSLAFSHEVDFGLHGLLDAAQTISPQYVLSFAITGALFVWAWHGGLAVLSHGRIRWQLARTHLFPWHAQRFLEEATARILLRRIGGGYSFPHRLLLDYFADLEPTEKQLPGSHAS